MPSPTTAAGSDQPLTEREFAGLMASLAPFEAAPALAVAVSGGADSMALALLAATWTRRRRGRLHAFTVDHGLRPESRREARQVSQWLRQNGLSHHILPWQGAKPDSGLQAAARDARYALLTEWCRRHGLLHLLTAHHLDDQAETVLMRLARGSGLAGLAGIPAATSRSGVRVLRPLLNVPRSRLHATLRRRRQVWLEDPSNSDRRFARTRARAVLGELRDTGVDADAFAALSRTAARACIDADARLADDAAAAVRLSPAGFAEVCRQWWQTATTDARRDLLAALLRTLGPGVYPVRRARVERLLRAMVAADGGRWTLAGCRVLLQPETILLCRESGRLPPAIILHPGTERRWDRFRVRLARDRQVSRSVPAPAYAVGALGSAGWRQVRDQVAVAPPAAVRPALPALWSGPQVLAVPHLGFPRVDRSLRSPQFSAIHAPAQPFVPALRRVV